MATNFTSPQYPVISWQTYFTLSQEIEVECDGNSVLYGISDAEWQGLWGFASTTGTNAATSVSLHGYLASKIQTFLQTTCGFGTAVCQATYVWDLPGWPRVRFNVTNVGGNDVYITPDSEEVAHHFGISDGGVVTVDGGTGEGFTDFNSVGYWAPKQLTLYDDRATISPSTYVSTSLDGATYKTRTWTTSRTRRSLTFPFVKQAYIWEWRAEDPGYYPDTDRDAEDPNNVFQQLLAAARRNNDNADSTQFRVYNKAGLYRLAVWSNANLLEDVESSMKDQSNGAKKFMQIIVPLEDLGDDGTGSI